MQETAVLVTGGAKRVGSAICRRLHGEGARIVIHYNRSMREAQALQAELNALRPASAAIAQADLLDIDQLDTLVKAARNAFGRLDVLINNASSFFPTPVGNITEQAWFDLVGTNLKAPLFLSQAAAAELAASQGCIVNITDIHADRPLKNYVVYSIAKAGLAALTKSLASELGPRVRVNGVAPGPVLWPENDPNFADNGVRQRIIAHTSLKRAGTPDDIAAAVRYLVCDAAFVTGQIIAVDGGRSVNL